MQQPTDPTLPHYYVAQLETVDGQGWMSLHITNEDAERKLAEVAAEWGIDDLDGDQIHSYGISCLPVHNLGE